MKKLSLLVGALGGTLAGYLFSNRQLREELTNAKDPEAAAKALGKHLQRDGKKLAKEVQEFVESEDVQKNLTKAKKFAKERYDEARSEIQGMVKTGAAEAKKKATKRPGRPRKIV